MTADKGRIVPPHASGPEMIYYKPPHIYRQDPDETRGRGLYRARADAEARRELAYERHKARLISDGTLTDTRLRGGGGTNGR